MSTQSEQAAELRAVNDRLVKISGEITTVQTSVDVLKTRITDLEAIIAAGGDATQELTDAVAAVKAQAQIVDDQIPDAPAPGA